MFDSPIAAPFDYEAVSKRQADFMLAFLKSVLGGPDPSTGPDAARVFKDGFNKFLADAGDSLSEVKRLHDRLNELKSRHMPFAGTPGAPAKCTTCSMHGAEVAWPCEVYTFADASLPTAR